MADPQTTYLNLYKIGAASDNVGVHMITHYNYNIAALDAWIASHDISAISLTDGVLTVKATDNTIYTCDLGVLVSGTVAPAFDDTATYAVGDFVIYGGALYECTTAHSGAWAAGDFTVTTIAAVLANIESALADKQNKTLTTPLTIGGITQTTVEGALGGLNTAKEDVLDLDTHTATGNPATFTTEKAQIAVNTVIEFEPIQAGSGDPSPSNPRTISGYTQGTLWTNGNVWDEKWVIGALNSNGSIDETATTRRTSSYISVMPNTTYRQASPSSACNGRIAYYNSEKVCTYFNNAGIDNYHPTFTTDSDTYYVRITFGATYGTTYNHDISINYPSTVTTYQPYDPNTNITIDFGQTVYGGTLDVERGVLTVDSERVDLGSLSWAYDSGYSIFYNAAHIGAYKGSGVAWTCEIYAGKNNVAGGNNAASWTDYSIGGYKSSGSNDRIFLKDSRYTDGAQLQTALNGIYGVYKLATPYTIQLPPHIVSLLQGANTVTTNGTSISITYRDGKVVALDDADGIAESVNALSGISAEHSILLDNICSVKASGATNNTGAQINSGSFFLLDGVFCKALANISANASFTLNTNYKTTTIAEELMALA